MWGRIPPCLSSLRNKPTGLWRNCKVAQESKLIFVGPTRKTIPLVYVLAAYLEKDEAVWVEESTLHVAAVLLSEGIIPVEANRCRHTGDIVIRPASSPLADIIAKEAE